jgi:sigma-B regulation protein RsbU (phosphoserine phosphatase)
LNERAVGVINVNNKLDGTRFDGADQAALNVVARFVTIAMNKAQMREIVMQKQRFDVQLQAARRIQDILLPHVFPEGKGVEIAATNLPAAAVAGDFYDVIPAPSGELWVLVGDVCSKGLPAALYMARVLSYFRVVSGYHHAPGELLRAVNDLLCRESQEVTFATVCVLMFDKPRQTVTIATAGHPDPLLYRPQKRAVKPLEGAGGPPLAIQEGARFEERRVRFGVGQVLLAYTDGVTEARNARGRLFGLERLQRVLRVHHSKCTELLQAVVSEVQKFTRPEEIRDDLTLVALRKLPSTGETR